MTTRDLLRRVFSQQTVDRIPVSPFIHFNYVREFFGDRDVDWVAKTPEVYRHFGFDVIHRNCTPSFDPFGPSGTNWQLEVARQDEGRDVTKTIIIHTPEGDLRCVEEWRWTSEYEVEHSFVDFPVKTEKDLDLFLRYQPPFDMRSSTDIPRAKAAVGDDGIVAPWIQGAFNLLATYYRKLDDLLVDALSNPNLYHRLRNYCLNRYMQHVQRVIDADPDVLSYSGNMAGGKLVSPDFFRRCVFEYEKRLISFIQSQGVMVLYHNCGYARKLLPIYPSLGMSAYESLTSAPHGDTLLHEAVNIFGTATTLVGNIDQIDLLRQGTPEEIRDEVKNVLDTVRGHCHFVLGTSDFFNENTPRDNIHALAEAGHRYGSL